MKPDIESESRFFHTPHAFYAPVKGEGGFRQNIAITFGTEKLEWFGYPKVKKLIYLFVLTESTNGQSGRQTERHRMTAKAVFA